MFSKLRERSQGESGFTLVELLVVMLILGLLAAIAIPAFFNQTNKAKDASAKSDAKTAQTAMETFRVDHNGSYAGAQNTDLSAIEQTLAPDVAAGAKNALTVSASNGTNAAPAAGAPGTDNYRVTVKNADTGESYFIDRASSGTQYLGCTPTGQGGCPSTGTWG